MTMYHYSPLSHKIGQRLIKKMGLYCAARYLRNLGISCEDAVEYLAVKR